MATPEKCLWGDCPLLEEMVNGRSAGGYCAGHRYRKRRNLPMDTPISEALGRRQSPLEGLKEAAFRLADCPTDEAADPEFRRRVQMLIHYALVYAPTRKGPPRRELVSFDSEPVVFTYTVPTGVACPHCKLQLVLSENEPPSPEEIAKRARLLLVQHVARCPKKA